MAAEHPVKNPSAASTSSAPAATPAADSGLIGEYAAASALERWTAGRKVAVVLVISNGKATSAQIARQFDLTVAKVDGWVEGFTEGGKEGLRAVPRDLEARFDAERKDLLARGGELTLQVDALKRTSRSASMMLDPGGASRRAQSV